MYKELKSVNTEPSINLPMLTCEYSTSSLALLEKKIFPDKIKKIKKKNRNLNDGNFENLIFGFVSFYLIIFLHDICKHVQ